MKNYLIRKITLMKMIYRLCKVNNQSMYNTIRLMSMVFESPYKLYNKKNNNK